jgi:predicted choloylglycine hydrolase
MSDSNSVLKKAKDFAFENAIVTRIRQRRPITIIDVYLVEELASGRVRTYNAWHYSKCRYPDVWDEEKGVTRAKEKATALIAKDMVADGWTP